MNYAGNDNERHPSDEFAGVVRASSRTAKKDESTDISGGAEIFTHVRLDSCSPGSRDFHPMAVTTLTIFVDFTFGTHGIPMAQSFMQHQLLTAGPTSSRASGRSIQVWAGYVSWRTDSAPASALLSALVGHQPIIPDPLRLFTSSRRQENSRAPMPE